MKLNEEQTLAVQHPVGSPAVLIAGAGSGKTATMTARVKWLIDNGVKPRRICAITFTNRAAETLIKRIGIDNPFSPDAPRVSTIHSLALGGIRKNPQGFGLQAKISPIDDYDQQQLLKKIIERRATKTGRDEEINVYSVLEKIGFHRARGVGFRNEYTIAVHERALKEHAGYHALDENFLELWELFEIEKQKSGLIDFDDMLWLFNRRAQTDAVWLARVQGQFDHVLVDECQDLSKVQWQFVNNLLGLDNRNLFCTGDVSQSIYAFNGASPELMIQYSEGWRGVVPNMYKIARNHRSMTGIVHLANKIQKTMIDTIPLQMTTWRKEEGTIKKIVACLPKDIASAIATEIQKDASRKHDPVPYKENAILVRSASQIRDIEGELVRRRIPYIVRGGRGLLQTEEVRDILSYLRLASNHKDFTAFMRCCSIPRCGVGEVALNKFRVDANVDFDGDLVEAAKQNERLHNLVSVIEQIEVFREAPVDALEKLLALFNYRAYIATKYAKDKDKVKLKLENIERFIFMVISLTNGTDMTLDDLMFRMTLERPKGDETEKELYDRQLATGELTQDQYDLKIEEIKNGSVTISTMHSAKGLEWPKVFIFGVVEGQIPHRFSMGSESELCEEKRILYVACTRARDQLAICIHEREQRGPNVQRVAPSRFLKEINI